MSPKHLIWKGLVGDPGIEPGAGFPGGVTVHCRTLQRVAHLSAVITGPPLGRQDENKAQC